MNQPKHMRKPDQSELSSLKTRECSEDEEEEEDDNNFPRTHLEAALAFLGHRASSRIHASQAGTAYLSRTWPFFLCYFYRHINAGTYRTIPL